MLTNIIIFLQNIPVETILCLEYLTCILAIISMVCLFGKSGLIAYMAMAIVVGNIQVLKTSTLTLLGIDIALGTIVFSSTFIVTDILSEFYGVNEARKAVWIGFVVTLFITLVMILTIGIKPTDLTRDTHYAIEKIFFPLPSLFCSSLVSYVISQHVDIWIFQAIRSLTAGKYLGLRTALSSTISSLLDNIIFSTLAFYILTPHPLSLNELIYTYILGTYVFRIIVMLMQTPIIYFVRKFCRLKEDIK